jgi:hypothetical protein
MNAARGPDAPWPNLFVVGAGHAGTTTLWRNLGRHPEIWMAENKEPNFFSGISFRLSDSVQDEAAYLRLFAPGAGKAFRGEASPSYLWSKEAPARIKAVSPEARILISLRDPVERTYSSYWYTVRTGFEKRPFAEAVRGEIDEGPHTLLGASFYAKNVQRYLRIFPGAVHVLFLENLRRDPREEMRTALEFLGLDPEPADRMEATTENPRALPRTRLTGFIHNSPRIRGAARSVVPRGLRLRAPGLLLKRAETEPIDPHTDAELTELLAPDVGRLESLLGREAPWPRFRHAGN